MCEKCFEITRHLLPQIENTLANSFNSEKPYFILVGLPEQRIEGSHPLLATNSLSIDFSIEVLEKTLNAMKEIRKSGGIEGLSAVKH